MTNVRFQLIPILFMLFLFGCEYQSVKKDYAFFLEDKNIQEIKIDNFNVINIEGNFILYLKNGDEPKLEFLLKDELTKFVFIDVKNEELNIGYLKNSLIRERLPLSILVTVPAIKRIKGSQEIQVFTPEELEFDSLKIILSGSSRLDMLIKGCCFEGVFSGASKINMFGSVDRLKINMAGAGEISAFDLVSKDVVLSIAGAGKSDVFAPESLKVNLAGACLVRYKGNPEDLFSNINGIGRLLCVD